MKKITNLFLVIGLVAMSMTIVSCGDDDPVAEVFEVPVIGITSHDVSQTLEGIEGEPITFEFNVSAEAGLSSVKLGDDAIKTYTGTELSDTFTYEYVPVEVGEITITFNIEDVESQVTSIDVNILVEKGFFLLMDLAGESTLSETKLFRAWDTRTVYTFDVAGGVTDAATAEVIASQAAVAFAQENPLDATETVFKMVKTPDLNIDGITNWGGWATIVFDLGSTVPQSEIDALPHWDNDISAQIDGTKVVQIDAYYDDSVDPDFNWNDLLNVDTNPWGSDPTLGYKLQLTLGAYGEPAEEGLLGYGGHNGQGYHITYIDYIDKPNEWVTLTFYVDALQAANFYPTSEDAVASDAVDAVMISPAGGYEPEDSNPLYLRNLRIIEVE